jgi:HEAT repeat protein
MHDGSTKLRSAVATALGKCGGPAAVPDLIEMLRDADREVRHSAVCGLGEICNVKPMPAALEPNVAPIIAALIEGMDDEYEQVRAFARRALRDLQDPAAIPGLVTALAGKRKYPGGITEVLRAFEDAAVPALRTAIHDPNARVRLAAIDQIARYGEETDAPVVAEAIRDADPDVRLRAIKAVGSRMGESTLIQEALVERLHDREEDVCLAAIQALGDIRSASTAPQLIECMKVEALAPYAASALQWIDTREARAALKAWNKTKK